MTDIIILLIVAVLMILAARGASKHFKERCIKAFQGRRLLLSVFFSCHVRDSEKTG